MAAIRKRGKRWHAEVRKAGSEPLYKSFPTKAAAERWAKRIELDIEDGRIRTGHAVTGTVAELIERYEREVDPIKSFGRSKASSLGLLKRGLGGIKVRDLDATAVIRFAHQRRAEGAGPVTISVDLSYLGTVLRTARALWRLSLSDEPVREARDALRIIGLVGRSRSRNRRPSQAEIDALCARWRRNERQKLPMADIVEFAIASAMRLGEICRIRWADLDAAARTIMIRDRKDPRAKSGNDQEVPLLQVTGYDGLEIIVRQPRLGPCIFPYKAASVSTAFDRGCEAAGIVGLTFHDLRHEAVSRLFEAGLRIEQVALISGHRDWQQLRRYTQLRPRDLVTEWVPHSASARRAATPGGTRARGRSS